MTDVTSGYDVTSGHMTDVTSGHMTYVTSCYDGTSGSTEQQQQQQQYSQSNDEESYYILKTNNPRFFCSFLEPLYRNVFYVIESLLLVSVSRKQDPHM